MEEEQPAAAPIVGEELPGEAELQLEVEQEPGALAEAAEALDALGVRGQVALPARLEPAHLRLALGERAVDGTRLTRR